MDRNSKDTIRIGFLAFEFNFRYPPYSLIAVREGKPTFNHFIFMKNLFSIIQYMFHPYHFVRCNIYKILPPFSLVFRCCSTAEEENEDLIT